MLHNQPFFSTLQECSMLVKKVVLVEKIKILEERIARRYKSYSNYPVIEPDPLPERCFKSIVHLCMK
jgi:hypothetical protein